jgi:regulator of sigma E protease
VSGAPLTILATLVVIGVLVFVHEFGHFVAAKLAGIYVHRFSLGLGGPIPWLSFRKGETEYAVSWLPLGGYVKMASRLEDPASMSLEGRADATRVPPDRVFEAKPVWLRMIVILAGVAMNVLFAWIVFSALLVAYGVSVLPVTRVARVDTAALPPAARTLSAARGDRIVRVAGREVDSWDAIQRAWMEAPGAAFSVELAGGGSLTVRLPAGEERRQALRALQPDIPPVIADVVAGRPGARAGLAPGDTIVAFEGEPVALWIDLVDRIASRAGQEVELLIGRPGGRVVVRATPAAERQPDSAGVARTVGRLGIAGPLVPERRVPVPLGQAVIQGGRSTLLVSTLIAATVKGIVSGSVPTRELGGPISIGVMAGESARQGGEEFLRFMAFISVNLAILNLLPIPVLDGGQFLFLLAEAVTRRPVTGKVREWLGLAGLVVIVLLMLLAFSNDIRRLLGV